MTVAEPAGVGAPGAAAETTQRARILDAALTLVSETGAAGTSMRRLASACGLNVATIYHYFPSKADLLRALVEEQHYGERMATDDPPMPAEVGAHDRFVAFFAWVVEATLQEEAVLRLLVGEGMHGDTVARDAARDLLAALDATVAGWLAGGFPELAPPMAPPVAARLVRRALLSVVTEHLATGQDDRSAAGDDLAAALFG